MVNSHTHEWRQVDGSPIIEDGAAIFREECTHVDINGSVTSDRLDETFYDEGDSCNAHRTYRFEYSYLISTDGTRLELPEITEWDEVGEAEEKMVEHLEEAYHSGDADINVCPAREYGEVVISAFNWELHFEP